MLNSSLMIQYYSFFQQYWQGKYTLSSTNAETGIAQQSLVYILAQVDLDDTAANQQVVANETAAQQVYLLAFNKNKAGILTDAQLKEDLASYQTTKAARRAKLPAPRAYLDSLSQTAISSKAIYQKERDWWAYSIAVGLSTAVDGTAQQGLADCDANILELQSAIDIIAEFNTKINSYVSYLETEIDSIETTGKTPATYQSIIDSSNYTYDGTYSDDVNHISPQGNLFGQITMVKQVDHLYWWSGPKWLPIPDAIDQAANTSLLPIGRPFGDIFRVPRYVAASNSYVWDYFYSTGNGWELMTQYWDVEGIIDLLAHNGYKVGDYHKVIERDVPFYWDSYAWERIGISVFVDDIGLKNSVIGLNAAAEIIRSDHNELLESFTGFQSVTAESFSGITGEIADIAATTDKYASDGYITLAEANALKLSLNRLVSSSTDMLSVAGNLGLTTEAGSYSTALSALTTEIGNWIDQTTYPKAITSQQRTTIKTLFETAEATEITLVNAISAKHGDNAYTAAAFDVSQFREVYDGFVRGLTPELALAYISQNELSLQPNYTDFDYLKVNDQNIQASKRTSVFVFTPVLSWNEEGQNLYQSILQPSSEYWVYLANRSDGFQTSTYDYRGRLFCSLTEPSSNYLGESGLGLHAILIGRAETDSNTKFRHELDVSLVSRQSNTKETFREFSNFDLEYTDEDTLTLTRLYGTYGQIYIPESLYYIGENREAYTTSPRIEVDVDENLVYDTSAIDANTLYYVYIAADSDVYNFNSINEATNRPWHPEDPQEPSLYDADKDFRLWMFLSTKEPEEGRLAETYQGFWARHIGQVRTDGVGKFIYSGGVSAIRQATLQPEYFDGLAEISILDVSTTTFKVIRKRGTSGIVMVGSRGTLTYDADNPLVHTVTTSDTVYEYDEETPSSPLSSTSTILDIYIGRPIYLYLANDRPCWGSLANRTFLSNQAPTDAYLSQNFPGNNARWIATVQLAAGTKGAELVTNGNFVNSNDWDGHSGWGWSEANLNAYHNTGNTSSLDQISMTVVAGGTYEVAVTVSGVSAGSVTPKLGNTLGTAITSAQRSVQYVIATNTDVLKFVPTSDFNGAIDTVTCFKVEHGAFAGSYITDSIAKAIPTIDDTIISPNTNWSSQKIMQVINDALGVSGTTSVFNAQKTGGLNLRLEYVDTTTVRLIPASGQDNYVVFPDLSFRTIPAAGITLTVSGSANTRHYVYLTSSSFYMSTTPPDNFYTKLETLGTATIKVGDICMTSTNTMSGNWNVCSSHQEPTREWSAAINGSSLTLSLPGYIEYSGCISVLSRTGVTTGCAYLHIPYYWGGDSYTDGDIVTGSLPISVTSGFATEAGTLTVTINSTNKSACTYSDSMTETTPYNDGAQWGEVFIKSRTGNLVLTRSAT